MNERDKRVWVRGLLVTCPFGTAFDDCPIKEMRKLPLNERMQLVDYMPEQELDIIVQHHEGCHAKREKEDCTREF